MKIKYLLEILFIFCFSLMHGQDNFSTSIDIMQASDSGFDIKILPDGYIILGGLACYNQNDCIGLVKTDFDGNIIWKKQYDILPENIIAGDKGLLIFNEYVYVAGGKITTDFDFQMMLSAMNLDGDLIWEREYGSETKIENLNYIIRSNDNNILTAGFAQNENSVTGEVRLMKVDTLGDILWEKAYTAENKAPSATGLLQLPSGHILIPFRFCDQQEGCLGIHGSRAGVYCLDEQGNLVWHKVYPDGRIALETIPKLISLPNKKYVLSWTNNYYDDLTYPTTQFPFPPVLLGLERVWEFYSVND